MSEIKAGNNLSPSFNGANSKMSKLEKDNVSGSKIASPKVTFHNSPMMSPQNININSPKRKISNPAM